MDASSQSDAPREEIARWWRILKGAKGPLGLITVLAIGVATLDHTAVAITIQNHGCATMYPATSIPISIPGLSLPKEPLVSGGSVEATIPGFTVSVDGTSPSALSLQVLTYTISFQLPSDISDVRLDGTSLLGAKSNVKLSESESHTLVLRCS
jgi:hypothetical protein